MLVFFISCNMVNEILSNIIYFFQRKSHRYYPTRLAINLTTGIFKGNVDALFQRKLTGTTILGSRINLTTGISKGKVDAHRTWLHRSGNKLQSLRIYR